ncbi:MAG TPA: extracellular solute-binding protein [Trueperaceae bacterium]
MGRRLVTAALAMLAGVALAQPVTITWLVGLGAGAQPEQAAAQDAIVAQFNAEHDDIELEIVYVTNEVSVTTLSTLIATGEAPDIVGPVGGAGSVAFAGNFLDLQPLIEADGYDLGQFPEAAVDNQRTSDGLIGIPFASFPAFLYYRPALFDEAGLEYPPANIGDPYVLDGQEVEWNMDTLAEVAKILTVDANGNDATMPEFDGDNTVQWGFVNQWAGAGAARQNVTLFGPGLMVDENGNAQMPDNWREGWKWYYDAIWTDQFMPNAAEDGSDLLAAGNPFESGNVAMAQSHLWYTCCLSGSEWNAAALPSYNGTVTARLHADTFRVMKQTEHPEEAFEVLKYLTGPASMDLLAVYGGMPTRPDDQAAFFATLDEKYPQGVNWDVARAHVAFADVPSHETAMPNHNRANDRLDQFKSLLDSQPGLDVDAEIDRLIADLQVIFDEAQ